MKTILTERFKKDMISKVHSKKIFAEIKTKVLYLETIPTMGSSGVPQSITEVFGTTARKLPNPPFLSFTNTAKKTS